ncbi:MAG: hypothetical protein M4579_003479 [Chaenotheca gracillima]|nr:MAG: hypothetical protein M4579_003479 [Chaenotheca gracillima]
MASFLPPIPKFIFTVFEPLSLIAGTVASILNPNVFSANQIPGSPVRPLSPNDLMTTLQLSNLYLLCAMVGVGVLFSTTEPKVVRGYLIGLGLADIGHLAATYYVLGPDTINVARWNPQTAGNVGATAFLFLSRCLYLLGAFGADRQPKVTGKKAL